MTLMSWGMYPRVKPNIFKIENETVLRGTIQEHNKLIPYGNGRSYGDSALAPNIIYTRPYDYFLDFDEHTGLLHVQAGTLLSDILTTFMPRGWFLKITPGTKFVTVGGAIASDVHGKNRHRSGSADQNIAP